MATQSLQPKLDERSYCYWSPSMQGVWLSSGSFFMFSNLYQRNFTHQALCCISKSTMKKLHDLERKLNLSRFMVIKSTCLLIYYYINFRSQGGKLRYAPTRNWWSKYNVSKLCIQGHLGYIFELKSSITPKFSTSHLNVALEEQIEFR